MDNKKKPPPGATLISRLRESRLRREQELAERGLGPRAQPQQPAVEEAPQAVAPAQERPGAAAIPPAKKQPAAGKEATDPTARAATVSRKQASASPTAAAKAAAPALEVQAEELPAKAVRGKPPAIVEPAVLVPQPVEAVEPLPVRTRGLRPSPADLIHRSISLEDLRPVSDDYDQLTEEIRLAGRFAAAGLIAQGLRLARLKDDALYKEHFATFEDYCRQEHSMSATYAYRLIRMAEMAERLAEEGARTVTSGMTEAMPDPFEVMLGLGHRHLMALLPLETEAAEDLLLRGVPLAGDTGKPAERIPITKATEQQIRQALKLLLPESAPPTGKARTLAPAVPGTRSVRIMADIVQVLQDWADWLESGPSPKLVADRIGEGRELTRLAQQLRKAGDRIFDALEELRQGERGKGHKA